MKRAIVAAALLLAGCDEGIAARTSNTEPLQVRGGQFFDGPLPVGTKGPAIVTIQSLNNALFAGQGGKKITGNAARGATAVALRFADLGTGYWSVPVGLPDPQTDGQLTWEADCDFSFDIPPGTHPLQFTASGLDGDPGPVDELPLLVQSNTPTGHVVISLAWDSPADLDLHVVTPDGTELDPKHPITTAASDPGMIPPGAGVLDRDADGSCVADNLRQEDAVFADAPAPGIYVVRVDMFASCGAPAADFVLTEIVDGIARQTVKGRLLGVDEDGGGSGSGLFVAQFQF